MAQFLNSLSAVALVLVMVIVGYLMGRAGWLKKEHKQFIVKLLVNIAVPCLCVKNLLSDVSRDMFTNAGTLLLMAFASIVFTLLLGLLMAWLMKIPHRRFGGFVVMCGLSNSLFIGYPMCYVLFGEEGVPFIMMFYMVNTFIFWTVGEVLISRSGRPEQGRSLKNTLKSLFSAPLVTLVICAALLWLGFRPPQIVTTLCGYFGGLVTPLALLYVGYVIYENGLKNLKPDAGIWTMMAVRFIAAPVSMLLLAHLLGISGVGCGVNVIEAAMPVMAQSVVVSGKAGADDAYCATGLTLSTLACFIVVPVLMLIVG